jgi:hypothetical protein
MRRVSIPFFLRCSQRNSIEVNTVHFLSNSTLYTAPTALSLCRNYCTLIPEFLNLGEGWGGMSGVFLSRSIKKSPTNSSHSLEIYSRMCSAALFPVQPSLPVTKYMQTVCGGGRGEGWVVLKKIFCRTFTLSMWPDSDPTKLLTHLGGEGTSDR